MSDMQITITMDELKVLIREAVREALEEVLDPDLSLEPNFAPGVAERLREYRRSKPELLSIDEVVDELGLDA